MSIKRYYGQPLPIPVKYNSNPLEVYGKTYADIEDISMNLKLATSTDADDAYLEKLQSSGGVTLDESNHRFVMILTKDDYTNLTIGDCYELVLAIKVSGIPDQLEMKLSDCDVEITKDKQRK